MTPQEELVKKWEDYLSRNPDYSEAATLLACIKQLKRANQAAFFQEKINPKSGADLFSSLFGK